MWMKKGDSQREQARTQGYKKGRLLLAEEKRINLLIIRVAFFVAAKRVVFVELFYYLNSQKQGWQSAQQCRHLQVLNCYGQRGHRKKTCLLDRSGCSV